MNMNMMEPLQEHDCFEPQTRARSNTWPLPRPDNYVDPAEEAGATGVAAAVGNKCSVPPPALPTAAASSAKKNSSRRNAWGNLSYADLITQAITTSPDKRLTLSQIYEWMVQNVPYFKDKGDSNSSAGWKVGIFAHVYVLQQQTNITSMIHLPSRNCDNRPRLFNNNNVLKTIRASQRLIPKLIIF